MDHAPVAQPPTAAQPELAPHAAMLRRYLYTLGASIDRIDDLIQQTFVVTIEKRPEDRGAAATGAWLRAVARNVLLRDRRTAAGRREVELADEVWREQCGDDDHDNAGADGGALIEALRICLRRLPARSRALVQRAYADGFGRGAIGAEFGLVADGVKTALRRVRAALRACVEDRMRNER